jgi:hypothetical protein
MHGCERRIGAYMVTKNELDYSTGHLYIRL